MLLVEGKRAARKATANLDAFDSYMRGLWHFHQLTTEDSRQASTGFVAPSRSTQSWRRRTPFSHGP